MTTLPERERKPHGAEPGLGVDRPSRSGFESPVSRSESVECDCPPGYKHDPSCHLVTGEEPA